MSGLVVLVKGSITLWLLATLSTVNFVLIKSGAISTRHFRSSRHPRVVDHRGSAGRPAGEVGPRRTVPAEAAVDADAGLGCGTCSRLCFVSG